jgi:hypothetical protein
MIYPVNSNTDPAADSVLVFSLNPGIVSAIATTMFFVHFHYILLFLFCFFNSRFCAIWSYQIFVMLQCDDLIIWEQNSTTRFCVCTAISVLMSLKTSHCSGI